LAKGFIFYLQRVIDNTPPGAAVFNQHKLRIVNGNLFANGESYHGNEMFQKGCVGVGIGSNAWATHEVRGA
jgi:hypothetical protein